MFSVCYVFVCRCVAQMCWGWEWCDRRGGVSVCVCVLTGSVWHCELEPVCPPVFRYWSSWAPLPCSVSGSPRRCSPLSSAPASPGLHRLLHRLLKLAAGRPSRHLLSVLVFLTAVNRKLAALTFLSCSCSSSYYYYYITVPASVTSVRRHVLLLLLIQHTWELHVNFDLFETRCRSQVNCVCVCDFVGSGFCPSERSNLPSANDWFCGKKEVSVVLQWKTEGNVSFSDVLMNCGPSGAFKFQFLGLEISFLRLRSSPYWTFISFRRCWVGWDFSGALDVNVDLCDRGHASWSRHLQLMFAVSEKRQSFMSSASCAFQKVSV